MTTPEALGKGGPGIATMDLIALPRAPQPIERGCQVCRTAECGCPASVDRNWSTRLVDRPVPKMGVRRSACLVETPRTSFYTVRTVVPAKVNTSHVFAPYVQVTDMAGQSVGDVQEIDLAARTLCRSNKSENLNDAFAAYLAVPNFHRRFRIA